MGSLVTGVLALQYEARYYRIKGSLLGQVVPQAQAMARERKESDVERALGEANQAIAKWSMQVYIPLGCFLYPKLNRPRPLIFVLVIAWPQARRWSSWPYRNAPM